MARRPKLTDTDREQRRAADRERLKQTAEQLLTSDGWQRWVRLRSRAGLARLSLSNQLLVAWPGPTQLRRGLQGLARSRLLRPQGREGDPHHRPNAGQGARPRHRRGDRRDDHAAQGRLGL
jgi:hypothetical protein